MRLSDNEFAALSLMHDFVAYYEQLNPDEMVEELDRLYSDGHLLIALHQQLSMYQRFAEIACFNDALSESQRSAIIGIATNLRHTVEKIILPELDGDTATRVRAALIGDDDYIGQFGYFPRAVDMIRVGARNPTGPYEYGPIGEILRK